MTGFLGIVGPTHACVNRHGHRVKREEVRGSIASSALTPQRSRIGHVCAMGLYLGILGVLVLAGVRCPTSSADQR